MSVNNIGGPSDPKMNPGAPVIDAGTISPTGLQIGADRPGLAGKAFESGQSPGGAPQLGVTPLAAGQNVPSEMLEQLANLRQLAGLNPSEVAEFGDVDIDVKPGELPGLPKPALLGELAAAFKRCGTDGGAAARDELLAFLNAHRDALRTAQQRASGQIFGLPIDKIREYFQPLIQPISGGQEVPLTVAESTFQGAFDADYPQDINALIQWVLRQAYLENLSDLRFFADKVRFYNKLKKAIRDEAIQAREYGATLGPDDDSPANYLPADFYTGEFLGPNTPILVTSGQAGELAAQGEEAAEVVEPEPPTVTRLSDRSAWAASNYDGSDDYNKITEHGQTLIDRVLSQLPSDPDARAALIEEWRSSGLSFAFLLSESDKKDNWYWTDASGEMKSKGDSGLNDNGWSNLIGSSYAKADPMRPDETLEQYVQRVIEQEVRDFRASVKGKEGSINIQDLDFRVNVPSYSVDGHASVAVGGGGGVNTSWVPGQAITNKGQMDAYLKNLETKLNSVGDDAQLANVDLQNNLQKQQQTLQMMSNISKMLHDTALAVIRKIGS